MLTNDEQVLKINTTNNSHGFVGNSIQLDHDDEKGWGDAILEMIDACIYRSPAVPTRTLKYDPHSNQTSLLVGNYFISEEFSRSSGALATDGVSHLLSSNNCQSIPRH